MDRIETDELRELIAAARWWHRPDGSLIGHPDLIKAVDVRLAWAVENYEKMLDIIERESAGTATDLGPIQELRPSDQPG